MCTRITKSFKIKGKQHQITGRNMDWFESQQTNIWIYPAGINRNGSAGPNSFEWTSKYKSITAAAYNIATSDGINEKGLVANLLWLADADFPKLSFPSSKKPISISIWAQMILDLCATVEEAIQCMKHVYVVTTKLPETDRLALCHLSVSDKKGNSVIFEYKNEQLTTSTNINNSDIDHLHVYNKKKMSVMTNEPFFNKQLKLNYFWEYQNEKIFLPGSQKSEDRFVRATYYSKNIEKKYQNDYNALASILSAMHNVAGPIGKNYGDRPNISPTWWTSISDHKELVYYFEAVYSPSIIWINLKSEWINGALDKMEGEHKALRLKFDENYPLAYNNELIAGNVEKYLEPSKTFTFLKIEAETLNCIEIC